MSDFFKQSPLTIPAVRKRLPVHPEIGSLFRSLRTASGWGLRQAARIAHGKGLMLLTMNSLGFLERGVTKNPDPELLREVAVLYGVAYEPLAAQFAAMRYGIQINGSDLVWQNRDQPSDLSGGPNVAAASPATSRLQQRYEDLLTAATEVAYTLNKALHEGGIAVPIPKNDGGNKTGRSGVRKRARKAG